MLLRARQDTIVPQVQPELAGMMAEMFLAACPEDAGRLKWLAHKARLDMPTWTSLIEGRHCTSCSVPDC